MGASTLGASSPSQYMRRTMFLRCQRSPVAIVNHMWLMTPGPVRSAIVRVSPAPMGCSQFPSSLAPVGSVLDTRADV